MKKIISSILVFTLIAVPASGVFATQSTGTLTKSVPLTDEKTSNVLTIKNTEGKEKMSLITH